jgi:hypothetical protein
MSSGRPAKSTRPLEKLSMPFSGGLTRSASIRIRTASQTEQRRSPTQGQNLLTPPSILLAILRDVFCVLLTCPTSHSIALADMKRPRGARPARVNKDASRTRKSLLASPDHAANLSFDIQLNDVQETVSQRHPSTPQRVPEGPANCYHPASSEVHPGVSAELPPQPPFS